MLLFEVSFFGNRSVVKRKEYWGVTGRSSFNCGRMYQMPMARGIAGPRHEIESDCPSPVPKSSAGERDLAVLQSAYPCKPSVMESGEPIL